MAEQSGTGGQGDRVVFVTGGSGGIGRASAANEGWS